MIHAPVVFAARKSPFFNTRFSFGCNSKFAIPPSIEITRRGNFRFHTRKNNFNIKSGRVSCETRRYYKQSFDFLHQQFSLLELLLDVPYLQIQ
jgi:hypothetical protein